MKKYSEDMLQIFIISMLKKLQIINPDILFWSTPNGGLRNKAEANKLKMTGLLAGVPDLAIMGKNKIHFIELKINKGTLSTAQKSFISKSTDLGFNTSVIYGDTPKEILPQVGEIMINIFGYQQKGISSTIASILDSSLIKGKEKS